MNTRTIIALIFVAVFGLATIAVTSEIRSAAERYLTNQETRSAATEKRTTELRDALVGYDKFKQADADRRKFERLVGAK